jgi:predicted MFS family arabinose efflux permease
MDRFGIKKMMYFDALTFIASISSTDSQLGRLPPALCRVPAMPYGWFIFVCYGSALYADRLVKSIYLRSIAWSDEEVTATLSMGTSLDHVVSILAALAGGFVWARWGSQWVFFMAALFSLGNLYVAFRVRPEKEQEAARLQRQKAQDAAAM